MFFEDLAVCFCKSVPDPDVLLQIGARPRHLICGTSEQVKVQLQAYENNPYLASKNLSVPNPNALSFLPRSFVFLFFNLQALGFLPRLGFRV